MEKQLFGTVGSEGDQRSLTLCRDASEPATWMIHCFGEKRAPFAVQADATTDGAGRVSLIPRLLFRENDGGAMFVPRLTDDEARRVFSSRAVLQPLDNGYQGHWRDGEGKEEPILMAPLPERSVLAENCATWAQFKEWAMTMRREHGAAIFRGHGNNAFRLKTTLHRAGMQRVDRYCQSMLRDFHSHAEAHLNTRFDLENGADYATVMGLAQHHGLPTPMLDWTDSPYIAAFFAFSDAVDNSASRPDATHIRIYAITREFVESLSPERIVLPRIAPYVANLAISARLNQRLYAQRGRFLVTNVSDLEEHLLEGEKKFALKFLYAADVPISFAAEALEELQFLGLSAASLFPGLDGVSRMLRYQMSFTKPELKAAKLDVASDVSQGAEASQQEQAESSSSPRAGASS